MRDRGDCYEYAPANAFSADLDNRQILAAAISNFERVAADSEATVHQLEADVWMLTGLGGLESSALLAPRYFASLGFDPQQHGCAVPTRDTCLWFAKSNANAVRLAENASRTAYESAQASERVAASLLVRSVVDGSYSFLPSNDRPRRGWMARRFGSGAGAV